MTTAANGTTLSDVIHALETLDLSDPDNVLIFNRGIENVLLNRDHPAASKRRLEWLSQTIDAEPPYPSSPLPDYAADLNAAFAIFGTTPVNIIDMDEIDFGRRNGIHTVLVRVWEQYEHNPNAWRFAHDGDVFEGRQSTRAAAVTIAALRALEARR